MPLIANEVVSNRSGEPIENIIFILAAARFVSLITCLAFSYLSTLLVSIMDGGY